MLAVKIKRIFISACLISLFAAPALAKWVTQETGTTQTFNALGFYVRGTNEVLGMAAGDNGVLRITLNGGITWEAASFTTKKLNDVFFASSTEGYLLGENGLAIKYTAFSAAASSEISFSGLPVAQSTLNFVKGSSSGTRRAIAASRGAAASGYILLSENSGASWSCTTVEGVAVNGVHLDPGGNLWVWGVSYEAGLGVGVLLKNNEVVYTNSLKLIRDVFFYDANTGYAVGEQGLFLKTTTGGGRESWDDSLSPGINKNFNALSFISADFGWVVGEDGTVAFTKQGGTSWVSYELDDPVNIKDIHVSRVTVGSSGLRAAGIPVIRTFADGDAYVYAFLSGAQGSILTLRSPTIAGVSPASRSQAWTGTLEVTGEGFLDGAVLSFSGPGITSLYASVESSTRLIGHIFIDPCDALPGARDVVLENPDATYTSLAGAFTVTSGVAAVTFNNIWLDTNKYLPPSAETPTVPRSTINPNPLVSFEVYSPNGLSIPTINAKIITRYGDNFIFSYISPEALTTIDAKTINVNYKVPELLPKDAIVNFMLYAEDLSGNVSLETLVVAVALPVDEGDPKFNPPPPPGTNPGGEALFIPSRNTWDPAAGPLPAQIVLKVGSSVRAVTVKVVDFSGRLVYSKRLTSPTDAYVTKINWNIKKEELAKYLSAGVHTVLVYNDDNGQLLAKNMMVIAPKSMRPGY